MFGTYEREPFVFIGAPVYNGGDCLEEYLDSILASDLLNISNISFVYRVLSHTCRHNEVCTSLINNQFI